MIDYVQFLFPRKSRVSMTRRRKSSISARNWCRLMSFRRSLGPAINWGWHGRAWSSRRFATARGRKACPSTLDRCRLAERASLVRLGLVPSASDASALASGTFFRVAAWLILSDGVLGRHVGGSSVGHCRQNWVQHHQKEYYHTPS